jgi:hypothetical protein
LRRRVETVDSATPTAVASAAPEARASEARARSKARSILSSAGFFGIAHLLLVPMKILGPGCQFVEDSFAVVVICRGWC